MKSIATMAVAFAALAGSAAAHPIAHVLHRRSAVAQHNGTHYETKWKEAQEKYHQLKTVSETAAADAERWLAIANANKEAFHAWGNQTYHKQKWDQHLEDRDQLFTDFLIPKREASTKKEAEYNAAQLAQDNLLRALNANHTQRKAPIETDIANDEKGMADADIAINLHEDAIKEQNDKRAEHKRLYDAHNKQLDDEVADFNRAKATIHETKEQLARDYGVWKHDHEVEWGLKSKQWNDNRDAAEDSLESKHNLEFQEWLAEKHQADISNGHCPCVNGGTCAAGLLSVDEYDCVCPAGYLGRDCEIDIDHCAGNPCYNGGTCHDGVLSHTCDCSTATGYKGQNCEVRAGPAPPVTDTLDQLKAEVGNYIAAGNGWTGAPIGDWDISEVTSLDNVFDDRRTFNEDLTNWDTSKVTSMRETFQMAIAFNGDVSNWNTAKVTDMKSLFRGCDRTGMVICRDMAFNRDLSKWITSRVTSMYTMFMGAIKFNSDIGSWDTSKLGNMVAMFRETRSFNQDISQWQTGAVTNTLGMFYLAGFNGDIGDWNMASVTDMNHMYANSPAFNRDLKGWNTAQVTNMLRMFDSTRVFNGDVSTWNTGKVTSMADMFRYARAFNRDLTHWNVANVKAYQNMYAGSATPPYRQLQFP